MTAYSAPGFNERAALSRQARQKALDQLRAKPPVDDAVVAERRAARLARDEAEAERRRIKLEKADQAKADKQAQAEAEAQLKAQAQKIAAENAPSEADKKAARDARYAARKKRK